MTLTHRQNVMLAALATRRDHGFAPVQVQKLFFLIDENIAAAIGGKQFAFEPYDYGPFDKAVYQELDRLAGMGLVLVSQGSTPSSRRYSLTAAGQDVGEAALTNLDAGPREFLARITEWVCGLSFAQLVGSIYKAYPNMRANSIFQD